MERIKETTTKEGKEKAGDKGDEETPSKKAQGGKDSVDPLLKKHLQYIEQPPTGVKHQELIDEYWFITSEVKVIVEPPDHYRTGKYKGYV